MTPIPCLILRPLELADAEPMAAAFRAIGWERRATQYERYFAEQEAGARPVLVAWVDGVFGGYVTVTWRSDYPPFAAAGIPEIKDLNVLPPFRRRRIASALVDAAEGVIAPRSAVAGIGVGMTADYGAAQRMYVRRGYVPDGRGLSWRATALVYGDQPTVDDDLVLFFTKDLN